VKEHTVQNMQTVFDSEGNEFSVEPVDAREYVQSGSYFYEPPAKTKAAKAAPAAKAAEAPKA
jgi:pyocin large subunit-like protein